MDAVSALVAVWYTWRYMTKLLEEALARVQNLPDDEQDRAAQVLIALATDNRPYSLSDAQIAGIELAMEQADHGRFADAKRTKGIFNRAL